MSNEVLRQMTGEGLLLMAIVHGEAVRDSVDAELDRRALLGGPRLAARRAERAATVGAPRYAAGTVTAA